MNEPLHPLTLSEILDRTAQFYRSRFLLFLGIAAIPAGIMFVFAAGAFAFFAWVGANARHGATVADILVWTFLSVLMILVIPGSIAAAAMGEAAITDAAARSFLGENLTIRSAYKGAWKRGWRYTGLLILQGLVILAAPAVAFVALIAAMIAAKVSGFAANDPSPVFGIVSVLLFSVLGAFAVWMLLRICLAFPACVVEQTTAWKSLKRCTELSRGTRWRIFVLYLLGLVLNQILAWAVTIPIVMALAFIPGLQGKAHAQTLGLVVTFMVYGAMFVVRALTKPVYGIALTLFYFDQRIRKEGFDIEWMMLQAGMIPTVPARKSIEAVVAAAEVDDWVSAPETATLVEARMSFDATEAIHSPAALVESSEGNKA
jgi:hypothetical protein